MSSEIDRRKSCDYIIKALYDLVRFLDFILKIIRDNLRILNGKELCYLTLMYGLAS